MFNSENLTNDAVVDDQIAEIDKKFRLNFPDLIMESKMLTHKCQFLCYKNRTNLLDTEECARKCFQPFLHIKKNVSGIVENMKEKFEKCRTVARNKRGNSLGLLNKDIERCISSYIEDINKSKDEIEYIYKGYMKNFEVLLKDNEKI
jgi:hypothetical protein